MPCQRLKFSDLSSCREVAVAAIPPSGAPESPAPEPLSLGAYCSIGFAGSSPVHPAENEHTAPGAGKAATDSPDSPVPSAVAVTFWSS